MITNKINKNDHNSAKNKCAKQVNVYKISRASQFPFLFFKKVKKIFFKVGELGQSLF
jgi:hypothetical protein